MLLGLLIEVAEEPESNYWSNSLSLNNGSLFLLFPYVKVLAATSASIRMGIEMLIIPFWIWIPIQDSFRYVKRSVWLLSPVGRDRRCRKQSRMFDIMTSTLSTEGSQHFISYLRQTQLSNEKVVMSTP